MAGYAVSYQSLPGRISIYRSLSGKWKLEKSERLESYSVGFEDYRGLWLIVPRFWQIEIELTRGIGIIELLRELSKPTEERRA